jgi:hypothetical protein
MILVVMAAIVSTALAVMVFGSKRASWELIESAGGMALGEPERVSPDKVYLPVRCDVSGLQAITHQPTTLNSGMIVKRVDAKVQRRNINISIEIGAGGKGGFSQCQGVELRNLASGPYDVFYAGPGGQKHKLATIRVSPASPNLASFRRIHLGMSIDDIFKLVGPADDVGSGLAIYTYELEDDGHVALSYGGPNNIRINYTPKEGKTEEIEVK